ncbi:MAG: MotA/TolQ/ExbB proton channel family protein [Phycisphaeraceae bacterium]|nr:MotA/TolQ/ExbB proton channel family protein [Phycisphaeraceae bacterium]
MTHPLATLGLLLAQDGSSKSLLQYVNSGGWIGYVIILLSFVAVGLIITQLIRIRIAALAPAETRFNLEQLLSRGEVKESIAFCQDPANDSFLTRLFGAALTRCSRSPFGFLELKSALEEAGQLETARLNRATDAVGLIASVAPMLGLLGTVVGMVGAFETISVSEGVTRPDQLAGSISLALITTVMGLIVAIPATAMYTYLRNRMDHCAASVAETTEQLASHLEGGAAPPRAAAAPARPASPRPATKPGVAREVRPA